MAAYLSRRLPPAATADLLALSRRRPDRYPGLLESAARGPHGRWDILFAFPQDALVLDAGGGLNAVPEGADGPGDFLSELDRRWGALRPDPGTDEPLPFRGGWLLYLGYELAGQVEPVLRLPQAPGPLPIALALRCPAAVLRDRAEGVLHLVAEADRPELLEALSEDLAACPAAPGPVPPGPMALTEDPPEAYLDGVGRVLDYIRAGDVFQVNLSRAWQARFDRPIEPGALYQRLRGTNPAPFAGLLEWGGAAVLSSSPERLVAVHGRRVETRPIAGTRPRGEDADHDDGLRRELIAHPKERAEHIMLLDLERNDLGRVAVPGSVRVDELMALESYAAVHHIVSNVAAELRPEVTPGQVIRAVFPGGTITGCPKVRCMEIIAELEGVGRGPYTGALGYLNRDGDLDLNILIRSLELSGNAVGLRAGAGIVVDSDPGRELAETRAKAAALLRALG